MNNQISFVTAFKRFKAPYSMIQHSALYSWKVHDIKVVASANEIGVKENCKDYSNITLINGVKRARELGFSNQSPIVRDLIEKALPHIETPLIGLINSDIIIASNFSENLNKILEKYGYNIFLASSRENIHLNNLVNSPESYMTVQKENRLFYDECTSSDVFITSKFWWKKIISSMPDFILGRFAWDNWLHLYAELNMHDFRYNSSKELVIIHCDHSYEHIYVQEKAREKEAPSSQYNLKLWKESQHSLIFINNWNRTEI